MRVLIAGGGTGGHLTPALAVAQSLREVDPGGSVVVVGRRGGVAERLVTDAGLQLETIDISGVDLSNPATVARTAAQLPFATMSARRLLRRMRPDVVVGAGGYVCVPVVLAANLERVPVVLMEQNAYPGRATRLLARHGRRVAASFAETAPLLPHARVVHTGNPIRREVRARVPAPLRDRCRSILVTGGSQGARRVNLALLACVRDVLDRYPDLCITHQSGSLDWERVERTRAALPAALSSRYIAAPFFDDIGRRIVDADLVVMRAGGSSLAECAALGRPMILVPYPHAGGHQRHNAEPFVRAGAAISIADSACDGPSLLRTLVRLIDDTDRWRSMAAASARMGIPDADARVVQLISAAAADGRA